MYVAAFVKSACLLKRHGNMCCKEMGKSKQAFPLLQQQSKLHLTRHRSIIPRTVSKSCSSLSLSTCSRHESDHFSMLLMLCRLGQGDLGANAERIREYFTLIRSETGV